MPKKPSLSEQEIYELKTDMWNGASHKEIMDKYSISYQSSVIVKSGRLYAYIPWPDGSTGYMPAARAKELETMNRFNKRLDNALPKTSGAPNGAFVNLTPEQTRDLEETARKAGFHSYRELEEHIWRQRVNEISEKAEREQAEKNATYDERQEAWLAAGKPGSQTPSRGLPDDVCDPSAQRLKPWEEVLALGARVPVVGIVEKDTNGEDPALKLAVQIVFMHFGPRQWKEDHVLRMIYSVKLKIERFWEVAA